MKRDRRLRYVGYADGQAKIRPDGIEFGEVQAALAELAGVNQAVVITREDRPGDRRLVGYVTESVTGVVDPAAARAALAERLPSYLVPAAVVVVEPLPVTLDGELDAARPAGSGTPGRRSLPRDRAGADRHLRLRARCGARRGG
ncbi:hypothetical protein A4G28_20105 [Mycobacterium ostraviense]|uniref:AMP-binding enzyme C-terminal domain-containing protein n=1 Tax=Mycobacterium ostraviense TaxID=2738409 RepID=A0A163XKM0_9MYCO|nr:hypothetical protein A4G28_20105 [Mycobacterium ostraviense]